MNEWLVVYAGLLLLLGFGIWRSWHHPTRPLLTRVALWWLSAALAALVVWSTLACTTIILMGKPGSPASLREWGMCVAVSAIWASPVILFALPFYALLLFWYVLRFGEEIRGTRSVLAAAAILGIPPALALFYGYASPFFGGVLPSLMIALPLAIVGWIAATAGLMVPRLTIRSLAAGRLVKHHEAA